MARTQTPPEKEGESWTDVLDGSKNTDPGSDLGPCLPLPPVSGKRLNPSFVHSGGGVVCFRLWVELPGYTSTPIFVPEFGHSVQTPVQVGGRQGETRAAPSGDCCPN